MAENNVPPKGTDTTIYSILRSFVFHLHNRSQQQHSELCNHYKAFMGCFDNTDEYTKKADFILKEPIKFFILNNKDYFSKEELRMIDQDYRLPELDFVYFRDTNFNKKLKTTYPTSSRGVKRYQRKLILAQVLDILAFIRRSVNADVTQVANDNNLGLPDPIILPDLSGVQMGVVGVGRGGK